MHITIIEDTSTSSLYGDDSNASEMATVDTEASEAKYLEMLNAAVCAAFPAATVETLGEENGHIPGRTGNVEIDGVENADDYNAALEDIDTIRHETWESMDWIVYNA